MGFGLEHEPGQTQPMKLPESSHLSSCRFYPGCPHGGNKTGRDQEFMGVGTGIMAALLFISATTILPHTRP